MGKPLTDVDRIHRYVEKKGSITRREVVDVTGMAPQKATATLRKLVGEGSLGMEGSRLWTRYVKA